jgi:hypothetical protein
MPGEAVRSGARGCRDGRTGEHESVAADVRGRYAVFSDAGSLASVKPRAPQVRVGVNATGSSPSQMSGRLVPLDAQLRQYLAESHHVGLQRFPILLRR